MHANQVHGMRTDAFAVTADILASIYRAGGEPTLIFPGDAADLASRLAQCDGLVVPGGADVAPHRYGQAADPTTRVPDFPEQDAYEAAVLTAAMRLTLPVLTICRGTQLLNVVQGGDLIQDIASDYPGHEGTIHAVTLAADSLVAKVVGTTRIAGFSSHHQAVARLGPGLAVSARADDGIVEAIEFTDHRPVLAVQWHPEDTAAADPCMAALFGWIVDRAAVLIYP
jgi:putative glutamine amidotransferase